MLWFLTVALIVAIVIGLVLYQGLTEKIGALESELDGIDETVSAVESKFDEMHMVQRGQFDKMKDEVVEEVARLARFIEASDKRIDIVAAHANEARERAATIGHRLDGAALVLKGVAPK